MAFEINSKDFSIIERDGRWCLVSPQHPEFKPFYIDFTSGQYFNMYRKGVSKKDPLARAIGIKKEPLKVLELTAGWLKDTWQMLVLGCQVTACEKNELVFQLVNKALLQINVQEPWKEFLKSLRHCHVDSEFFVTENDLALWDVIYIDPMFPDKKKSLSRKEMQILQELIKDDKNKGESLVELTLAKRPKRLVVKRPLHGSELAEGVSFQVKGKLSRFDVYINAE